MADPETLSYRRVTHKDDPVPLLPWDEWGYRSHAGEIYISKAGLAPTEKDIRTCAGDGDAACSTGTGGGFWGRARHTPLRAKALVLASRLRLWQLFFAHQDYFWRLGLCVPGGTRQAGAENGLRGTGARGTLTLSWLLIWPPTEWAEKGDSGQKTMTSFRGGGHGESDSEWMWRCNASTFVADTVRGPCHVLYAHQYLAVMESKCLQVGNVHTRCVLAACPFKRDFT